MIFRYQLPPIYQLRGFDGELVLRIIFVTCMEEKKDGRNLASPLLHWDRILCDIRVGHETCLSKRIGCLIFLSEATARPVADRNIQVNPTDLRYDLDLARGRLWKAATW